MMVDDAFITYRFAENLGAGHGPVFNPGERVEGYSNFLLVVLLAPFSRAGLDLLLVAKAIGFLSGLLAVVVLTTIARSLMPSGSPFVFLPALLLAGSASFALWTMAGIETTLFAVLILGGTAAYMSWVDGAGGRRAAVVSGLCLTAACLTRPEGPLFPLALGLDLLPRVRARRPELRETLIWGCAVLLPFLVFLGWRWSYYGALLPNTYYAKSWGGLTLMLRALRYGYEFLMVNGGPLLVMLVAAAIGLGGARRVRPLLAILAANAVFVLRSGDDWMPMHRFFVPSVPILCLLAAEGVRLASERMGPARRAVTGALTVCLLVFAYAEERYTSGNTRAHFRHEGEFAVAEYLKAHARPGDRVAVDSAGIIPYCSKLYCLDYLGLCDAHIARLPGFLHEKSDPDYVLGKNLDWVVMCGTERDPTPEQIAAYDVPGFRKPEDDLLRHPGFRQHYEFAAVFPMGNGAGVVWKRRG